jgi:hypothetical protein
MAREPAIAVSGLTFYTGDEISRWRNNLFVGGMRQGDQFSIRPTIRPSKDWDAVLGYSCTIGIFPTSSRSNSRRSRGRDDHRWAPPAQNRTGALTHTALTSDVWRRSVAGDRDAAPVGKESSDQEAVYAAATPPGHVDYDEPKRSATIAAADA